MAPKVEAGEFSLLITANDPATLPDAARDFAEAFSLDPDVALAVCKSAPIVFAQKLTKSEVKAVTPKLAKLSERGLEFRITARLAGKVPKLNWPARPQFTAAASGAATGLAWDWQNSAFVCPGCGEAYAFQRVGKIKLEEPPAAPAAPAPAPVAQNPRAIPTPVPSSKPPSPLAGRRPPPPLIPEPEPEPEPALEVAGEPPLDVSREAEEIAPLEPVDEAAENAPLPGEGEALDLPGAVEEIQLEEIEQPDQVELLPDETEPEPAPAEDEELYNVFLSKIVDKAKQARAVELICEIKGVSEDEARELTNRLVIPIAKGIPKSEAEGILERFKKAKIFGRMTPAK